MNDQSPQEPETPALGSQTVRSGNGQRPVRDDSGESLLAAGGGLNDTPSWSSIVQEIFSGISGWLDLVATFFTDREQFHIKSKAMGYGGDDDGRGPDGFIDEALRAAGVERRSVPSEEATPTNTPSEETEPQAADANTPESDAPADDVIAQIDGDGVRYSPALDAASNNFRQQFASAAADTQQPTPEHTLEIDIGPKVA